MVLRFNHRVFIGSKTLKHLIAALLLCLIMVTAVAATDNGELDSALGANGIVTTDHGTLLDDYEDIVLQPDHKIITVGTAVTDGDPFVLTVARYLQDGSLDNSFGLDGTSSIEIDEFGTLGGAVALQSNGKIVVVGSSANISGRDILVIRLETNGDLDTTFGANGVFTASLTMGPDTATDVVIQDNDQIVVSAVGNTGVNSKPFVIKLADNGSPDPSFGDNGIVEVPLEDGSAGQLKGIDIQNDNKIVVGGDVRDGVQQDFLTARLHPNGSLDTSFGSTGVISTAVGAGNDAGEGLVIQQDGKIVVAGSATQNQNFNFALVRFNTDGSLDNSFGNGGKVISPTDGSSIAFDVAPLTNGGIIAVGDSNIGILDSEIALQQFQPDGSLDPTFGDGGIALADVTSAFDVAKGVVRDSTTGRILVAGGVGAFGPTPDSAVLAFIGDPDEVTEQMLFMPIILSD